jgi:hypothetical protein
MCAATPAVAGTGNEALVGTGCALSNLVYGPTKLTFALIGGVVGGLAYVFSFGDQEAAEPILRCSLRGDYALTPEHFRGEDEFEFCGRSDEHRAARARAGQGSPSGGGPVAEDW